MTERVKKERRTEDAHLPDKIYLKKKVKVIEPAVIPVPTEFYENRRSYTKKQKTPPRSPTQSQSPLPKNDSPLRNSIDSENLKKLDI